MSRIWTKRTHNPTSYHILVFSNILTHKNDEFSDQFVIKLFAHNTQFYLRHTFKNLRKFIRMRTRTFWKVGSGQGGPDQQEVRGTVAPDFWPHIFLLQSLPGPTFNMLKRFRELSCFCEYIRLQSSCGQPCTVTVQISRISSLKRKKFANCLNL